MSRVATCINILRRTLFQNPLLTKELRIGLRENKVFIIQTIYLLILGVVTCFFLIDITSRSSQYIYTEAGKDFFRALCILQFFLVILISPSFTSGSISSEREKKTFDMLLVTNLSTGEILIGKLAYAVLYLILLLATSLPLVALVFFMGGVSPWEVLVYYSIILGSGILVCLLSLFFSSRSKSSSLATFMSYGALILTGIILFVLQGYFDLYYHWENNDLFTNMTFASRISWTILLITNVIWAALFLYYKIANYIRPQAKNILALHRIFIFGFIINTICLLGIFIGVRTGYSSQGYDDYFPVIFIIFFLSGIFFMGCFIERNAFLSKKEEAVFNKSITSHPYAMPFFFMGTGIVMGLFLTLDALFINIHNAGNAVFQIWASMFLFVLYLWIMIFITKILFMIFKEKARPAFIYLLVFLLMNLIPAVSWIIADIAGMSDLPIYSLAYSHPLLSIASIWDPAGKLGMVAITKSIKMPTFIVSLLFYSGVFVLLKIILSALTRKKGKSLIKPQELKEKPT
ncbi:MAG: hypothetical protein K8T10_04340 [Candidatus Eremiobacteraeota bacterium]|nr:hypothetical protein [Candidatus Eremiobacteraeota bacterium]